MLHLIIAIKTTTEGGILKHFFVHLPQFKARLQFHSYTHREKAPSTYSGQFSQRERCKMGEVAGRWGRRERKWTKEREWAVFTAAAAWWIRHFLFVGCTAREFASIIFPSTDTFNQCGTARPEKCEKMCEARSEAPSCNLGQTGGATAPPSCQTDEIRIKTNWGRHHRWSLRKGEQEKTASFWEIMCLHYITIFHMQMCLTHVSSLVLEGKKELLLDSKTSFLVSSFFGCDMNVSAPGSNQRNNMASDFVKNSQRQQCEYVVHLTVLCFRPS